MCRRWSVYGCRSPLRSAISAADSIAPTTSAALGVRSLGQVRSVMEGKRLDLMRSRGVDAQEVGAAFRRISLVGVMPESVVVAHVSAIVAKDGRPVVEEAGQGVREGETLTSPACAAPAAMLARCSRRPCVPPHSHRRRGSRCPLASGRRRSSPASLARARGRLSRRSARGVLRTAASRVGCCSSPAQQAAAGSYGAAWRDASA